MTDIDDQLRRYAAEISRTQSPIALGEIVARKRPRALRRGLVGVAAAVVAVAVIGGLVVVNRDHSPRLVVAPGPSTSATSGSTTFAPRDCPAAALAVTGTSSERLHPGWLPAGFVLKQGSETELGSTGGLMYSKPVNRDQPYVEIARYHSALPVEQLVTGNHSPLTVNGHDGIFNVGVPLPQWTAVAWREDPRTALIVTGYQIERTELLRVAGNLQYVSGSPFTYPAHPTVTVTREEAVAALGTSSENAHSALTSYGEFVAVNSTQTSGEQPPVAALPVTRPVWVAWAPTGLQSAMPDQAVVVDAESGAVTHSMPASGAVLDHLTDRHVATCAPPFGVLTRSEASAVRPARAGTTMTMKLTTLGRLLATKTFFGNCAIHICDPSVPAWLLIETAPDQRLGERNRSPLGTPPNTQPGSWTVSALDARTGPRSSTLGGFTSGSGQPPADVLAVTDVAPAP